MFGGLDEGSGGFYINPDLCFQTQLDVTPLNDQVHKAASVEKQFELFIANEIESRLREASRSLYNASDNFRRHEDNLFAHVEPLLCRYGSGNQATFLSIHPTWRLLTAV